MAGERGFALVTRRFGSLCVYRQHLGRVWVDGVVVHTQADCFLAWLAWFAATAAGTPQLSKLGRQVGSDQMYSMRLDIGGDGG